MEQLLEKIYTDPENPAGFSGVEHLYRAAHEANPKITKAFVKKWLSSKDSYTLNKPARRKFERSRVISQGLYIQADIDLLEVGNLAASNDKIRYLLGAIDILSRKAYVQPLKSKTGKDVAQGLEKLWGTDVKPRLARSDRGKEFLNKEVQEFFKRHKIHHFVTSNEVKANYIERLWRTLRGKLHRLITETQNERYIDKLQALVHSYNNKIHSSIGISPADVTSANERLIWYM